MPAAADPRLSGFVEPGARPFRALARRVPRMVCRGAQVVAKTGATRRTELPSQGIDHDLEEKKNQTAGTVIRGPSLLGFAPSRYELNRPPPKPHHHFSHRLELIIAATPFVPPAGPDTQQPAASRARAPHRPCAAALTCDQFWNPCLLSLLFEALGSRLQQILARPAGSSDSLSPH